MFLRSNRRFKDGKEHRYWNIVENNRCAGGKVVQRKVLYLGEINDGQSEAWYGLIDALDAGSKRHGQLALFAADREVPECADGYGVQVRLDAMELHRPRQWGAGWVACQLYEQLELDRFWSTRLPDSRKGTQWRHILQTLVGYRVIDPGSEGRLRRLGFEQSAVGGLLRGALRKIEAQYGKAQRIWVMDRGIPTEEVLAEMRQADPPVSYLVGTPKGRLSKLEKALLGLPWQAVRQGVDVKLLPQEQELYVLAQSHARIHKERAMRRRKLKWLWARLKQIAAMELTREELLMKLGAARAKARAAWRLIDVAVAPDNATFSFALNRDKLRQTRRREGRYLLRTNLCAREPAHLWQFYIQLVEVEAAFKNLKDDLQLRPIYHQLEHRIEAHIFVAFLAYCLHVTLRAHLKPLAPGLTPTAVLDKLAAIQMLDVHFPTTDGRTLILSRYTELNADQKLLVNQLKLDLPSQPPPRITAPAAKPARAVTQQV